MHQTFYIDADEEISSVIDRLRKSMAFDNYFVAPKRAIFLQSIVNLKLLKREAEKIKKRVILVSQEEVVIAMAVRSGIEVQKSIEGSNEASDVELDEDYVAIEEEEPAVETNRRDNKSARLNSIGSNSFYDAEISGNISRHAFESRGVRAKKVPADTAGFRKKIAVDNRSRIQKQTMKKGLKPGMDSFSSAGRTPILGGEALRREKKNFNGNEGFQNLNPGKEKKIEEMFSRKKEESGTKIGSRQISSRKTKNVLFIFILFCLFLFVGVAGYLYIPSANVVVKPDVQTFKIDVDVNAKQSLEPDASLKDKNVILLRTVNQEQQLTLRYDSTGKSSSAGKKSQGTVVVYNEFDSNPQTLVASTRLQTDSGKIFRLLKTIVVPGMTNVGGEMKPGAISVEVVADQPGSDYNLEPTDFKIPGFQGSPKHDKFYAKSSKAMSGGTTEGNASAGVSQEDLIGAKQKTEAALKEKIASAILAEMKPDEIALPQAEKITPGKSSANAKVGDGIGSFEYTASANVSALIFSRQDVEAVIRKTAQFSDQAKDAEKNIKNIEYISVEPVFENNTIKLKAHANIEVTPKIDLEKFKQDLLGKNENEIFELLKKNQSVIAGVNVDFWPTFISRIPQFPQRVKIELEKSK